MNPKISVNEGLFTSIKSEGESEKDARRNDKHPHFKFAGIYSRQKTESY